MRGLGADAFGQEEGGFVKVHERNQVPEALGLMP